VEIQMIGHASLFIKTVNLRIYMDPVLWDPHQEGLFDVFPTRTVEHHKLPSANLLIISHRHLDHFDLRSLAALPRSLPVLIPDDSTAENYLCRLGYTKIRRVKDFSEIRIGQSTIFTTRSENNVPEFGVVIADDTGVFWNQVDSVVSPRTVQTVLSRFPVIDLLLAAWQPMLEMNFQGNRSISFPYDRYAEILYNIRLASPHALSPGANGFRYKGAASWMNHIVSNHTGSVLA
jgi:UDP-MurNAc hydroxylase